MTALNYILISILYFWCSSTALSLGIGYYTLYRPIISGMIAGLILGDIKLGMLTGSIVNIIYIDFVSTGGSLKGDQCLTSIIASVAAILLKLSPVESAAIAYPFGYAGILIWKYRLNINCLFVRKYDEKYKLGLNPSISVYNGLLPQVLLFAMSATVIVISIGSMFMFKGLICKHQEIIKYILFIIGVFLINVSISNVLLNLKSNLGILIFFTSLIINLIFNINSIIIMIILLISFIYLTLKDMLFDKEIEGLEKKHERSVLSKRDLFYSWFVWMNFSHSCYNYERLQGMAFAHSMKNIIKKLYKDNNTIMSTINQYTEFFNTEPNIGTPIHGYIISLEEQKSIGNEIVNMSYIKKGMMGIAAGLGDSFTQVVLAPLFMSMALMLCLDKRFIEAMIPVLILGFTIVYISYSGWMNGYFIGKDVLIKRINLVKKNKIKKYFPLIFSIILGSLIGKLIILNYSTINNNLLVVSLVSVISISYTVIAKVRSEIKA